MHLVLEYGQKSCQHFLSQPAFKLHERWPSKGFINISIQEVVMDNFDGFSLLSKLVERLRNICLEVCHLCSCAASWLIPVAQPGFKIFGRLPQGIIGVGVFFNHCLYEGKYPIFSEIYCNGRIFDM